MRRIRFFVSGPELHAGESSLCALQESPSDEDDVGNDQTVAATPPKRNKRLDATPTPQHTPKVSSTKV